MSRRSDAWSRISPDARSIALAALEQHAASYEAEAGLSAAYARRFDSIARETETVTTRDIYDLAARERRARVDACLAMARDLRAAIKELA